MKLSVLNSSTAPKPWYAGGLAFTCHQCGNCCSGPAGVVWISKEEIVRLAEFLHISPEQVVEQYCRKVSGQFSLREVRNPRHGGFDCVFLQDLPPEKTGSDQKVQHARRGCTIYPVRPLQCRTWPFWPENLASARAWRHASEKCPGIDSGKSFDSHAIESLRDAADWPDNPPGSRQSNGK